MMRRLVFITQRIDPDDPVLGATVAKVGALAGLVDEAVVLCDSAVDGALPCNCRVRTFGSDARAGRGARFELALARELHPRPVAVVAHMVPLYALLAAPLVRPLRVPLLLWFTHWKDSTKLRAAERVCTAIVSVDTRSFPFRSRKVHAVGHGIDVSEFPCADAPPDGPLRAVALGRYSPAKGLEAVLRGFRLAIDAGLDAQLAVHGTTGTPLEREHEAQLEALLEQLRLSDRVELGGPVPRSQVPALFAASHVLVNNMQAGAPDKVVYEAAASCLPVLASNPVFDELLPPELRFVRDEPETLAERLLELDRRRRPELRQLVVEHHSVESWAQGILRAAE
jgi:glycosyltransferase involved in cell wall biosynthesis